MSRALLLGVFVQYNYQSVPETLSLDLRVTVHPRPMLLSGFDS